MPLKAFAASEPHGGAVKSATIRGKTASNAQGTQRLLEPPNPAPY